MKTADQDFNQGNIFFQNKQYTEALHHFNLALQQYQDLDPDFKNQKSKLTLLLKGSSLFHLGSYEEALPILQEASRFYPNDAELWYKIGLTHFFLEQYYDAIGAYDQALHCKPCFPQVLSAKGLVCEERGEYETAIFYYNRALVLQPNLREAWLNLGNISSMRGNHEEALEHYLAAATCPPENSIHPEDALNYAGKECDALGKFTQALSLYSQALELNPQSFETLFNQGQTLEKMGEDQQALFCYRQVFTLLNTEPETLTIEKLQAALSEYFVLLNLKQYEEAISCCEKMRRVANFKLSWSFEGYVYLLQKNFPQAENYFIQAISNSNNACSSTFLSRKMIAQPTFTLPSPSTDDAFIFALQGHELITQCKNKPLFLPQTEKYISTYLQKEKDQTLSQLYLIRGYVFFAFQQLDAAKLSLNKALEKDSNCIPAQRLITQINGTLPGKSPTSQISFWKHAVEKPHSQSDGNLPSLSR